MCKICDYELIRKFVVGSPTVYSDHCQIEFDINVHCIPPTDVDNSNKTKKYEWDDEHKDAFIASLNDTDTVDRFINLLSSIHHTAVCMYLLTSTADHVCIDELVVSVTNVIQGCADPLLSRHSNVKPNASLTKRNIPWMTPECKQ